MMNLDFLQENIDITSLSNFKTKAIARYYFEIHSRQDVDKIVDIMDKSKIENIPILFVSGGTNMLFAFDFYNGIVVKNCLKGWTYDKETRVLESYSSELISDIAKSLEYDSKQDLWHRFIGLPGSIGGAIFGNAGCFGLETENNFRQADVFDLEKGQYTILDKTAMNFSYRSSLLKESGKYFVIKAIFDLSKKIEKYSSDVDNIDFRENKQPKGNTCGSFFKNPSREYSAGYLIEQVGLKGYKLGGAYFSEIHANFLMNDGSGTYKDLLDLIDLAKSKVMEKFSIKLDPEVRIIFND